MSDKTQSSQGFASAPKFYEFSWPVPNALLGQPVPQLLLSAYCSLESELARKRLMADSFESVTMAGANSTVIIRIYTGPGDHLATSTRTVRER